MSRAKVSTKPPEAPQRVPGPPTTDEIGLLHGAVAQYYMETLGAYHSGRILDGKGRPRPIPASLLSGAAKFLANQGADRPKQSKPPVDTLKDELPKLPLHKYGDEPGLPIGARVTEPKVTP